MTYTLGIDAGGTSTRARLARGNKTLADGLAGSANPRQVGVGESYAQLERAIVSAFEHAQLEPNLQACAVFAGIAGLATEADVSTFLEYPHPYARLEVTSDALLALDAYFSGSSPFNSNLSGPRGALLIVGTGCIALARASDGTVKRRVGWGFPLEQGGGSDLGLQAVRLGLSDWEAGRSSAYQKRLEQDFPSPRALMDVARDWSAGDYARFSPTLLENARLGEARAQKAVQDWISRGQTLLEELKLEAGVSQVGVWGGLSESFLEFGPLVLGRLEGYVPSRRSPLEEALVRAGALTQNL